MDPSTETVEVEVLVHGEKLQRLQFVPGCNGMPVEGALDVGRHFLAGYPHDEKLDLLAWWLVRDSADQERLARPCVPYEGDA